MKEIITTCTINKWDRMRLGNVNQNRTLTENFTTVINLYEKSQLTPSEIDELNPSESPDSKHVLTLALEVLNDRIPKSEEQIPDGGVISIKRQDTINDA